MCNLQSRYAKKVDFKSCSTSFNNILIRYYTALLLSFYLLFLMAFLNKFGLSFYSSTKSDSIHIGMYEEDRL